MLNRITREEISNLYGEEKLAEIDDKGFCLIPKDGEPKNPREIPVLILIYNQYSTDA